MDRVQAIERLRTAIMDGDEEAPNWAAKVLETGADPIEAVKQAVMEPMQKVGLAFEDGDLYLPELMMIGDAAKAATQVLMANLPPGEDSAQRWKVVIGTIKGDLHDIGKNVVAALLTAHGFDVTDLGTDVSPKIFIETARIKSAEIVAISSLITTTLPYHREVVRILDDTGERNQRYVIVGGGPVSTAWASEVGADGYGRTAQDAVELCNSLLKGEYTPPLEKPLSFGTLT